MNDTARKVYSTRRLRIVVALLTLIFLPIVIGASVLIYMFELFVAFIQAFIFAILSAVYIGGALDQDH